MCWEGVRGVGREERNLGSVGEGVGGKGMLDSREDEGGGGLPRGKRRCWIQ